MLLFGDTMQCTGQPTPILWNQNTEYRIHIHNTEYTPPKPHCGHWIGFRIQITEKQSQIKEYAFPVLWSLNRISNTKYKKQIQSIITEYTSLVLHRVIEHKIEEKKEIYNYWTSAIHCGHSTGFQPVAVLGNFPKSRFLCLSRF